jgi:hypothetical protein
MKKTIFALVILIFSGSIIFAETRESVFQKTVDSDVFINTATEVVIHYFRKYNPTVIQSDENHAVLTVKFGRHEVRINITASDQYRIEITSNIDTAYLNKWIANLRKNITNTL